MMVLFGSDVTATPSPFTVLQYLTCLDIWKRILRGLRLFENSPTRSVEVHHVKAHNGEKGNERADKLAGLGAKLRHDLMVKSQPRGWFRNMVERYASNRI